VRPVLWQLRRHHLRQQRLHAYGILLGVGAYVVMQGWGIKAAWLRCYIAAAGPLHGLTYVTLTAR